MSKYHKIIAGLQIALTFAIIGAAGCKSVKSNEPTPSFSQNEIMRPFERKSIDPMDGGYFPDFVSVRKDSTCSYANLARYFGPTFPGGITTYWHMAFPEQTYNWYVQLNNKVVIPITPDGLSLRLSSTQSSYYYIFKTDSVFQLSPGSRNKVIINDPLPDFKWEELNPFAFRFTFSPNKTDSIKIWQVDMLGIGEDHHRKPTEEEYNDPIRMSLRAPQYLGKTFIFVQWDRSPFSTDSLYNISERL